MKFTENVEAYLQKKWVEKSEKFATGIKNQIEERSKQDEKNSWLLDRVGWIKQIKSI